jgi:hypothetical protein
MCDREAPCVSVRGLHDAGWQASARPVGWLCDRCRGPIVILFDRPTREAKMMVPDFSTKTIVAIVAMAAIGLAATVGFVIWLISL